MIIFLWEVVLYLKGCKMVLCICKALGRHLNSKKNPPQSKKLLEMDFF